MNVKPSPGPVDHCGACGLIFTPQMAPVTRADDHRTFMSCQGCAMARRPFVPNVERWNLDDRVIEPPSPMPDKKPDDQMELF